MKADWRKLRVGKRVRFIHMPTEFSKPGYQIHRDTLRIYRLLIARRRQSACSKSMPGSFPGFVAGFGGMMVGLGNGETALENPDWHVIVIAIGKHPGNKSW